MKRFTEQLKGALSAMACADFGELLGARDKERVLASVAQETAPLSPTHAKPARRIVLSLGDTLHVPVMDYAIGVCQRMEAELVVLSRAADTAKNLLDPYRAKLGDAKIRIHMQVLDGNTATALNRYLHSQPQVLFVISGGNDDPVHRLIVAGKPGQHHAVAPVPIVVVAQAPAPLRQTPARTPQRSARRA